MHNNNLNENHSSKSTYRKNNSHANHEVYFAKKGSWIINSHLNTNF
ncbi:hypothetical protein VCHA34P131_30261 [Vibrio chagasii]|nr:hypothetical protein VCHA34P121_20423 [Vibrio chagasii]CAH6890046.1 hypothetical protein VCHA34P131_30261 [Vibrio chagasii]CAH7294063.1 hypothetical protein VCHA41O245_10155 [Vibrio chagasii]